MTERLFGQYAELAKTLITWILMGIPAAIFWVLFFESIFAKNPHAISDNAMRYALWTIAISLMTMAFISIWMGVRSHVVHEYEFIPDSDLDIDDHEVADDGKFTLAKQNEILGQYSGGESAEFWTEVMTQVPSSSILRTKFLNQKTLAERREKKRRKKAQADAKIKKQGRGPKKGKFSGNPDLKSTVIKWEL